MGIEPTMPAVAFTIISPLLSVTTALQNLLITNPNHNAKPKA